MKQSIPVVYELDDAGEASGEVMPFCSDACADRFRMERVESQGQFPRYAWGKDSLTQFKELQCAECGEEIMS